jgi:hypothetical protein
MVWTAPVAPVAGTVITVAWATANVVATQNWLRLMAGNADPPGSNYVVVSSTPTTTAWDKVRTDTIADNAVTAAKLASGAAQANFPYTPVNQAGDIMSGNLILSGSAVLTVQGRFVFLNAATTRYLQYDNSADQYVLGGAVPLKDASGHVFWNSNNDGAGSGLDADTLDGAQLAAIALLSGAAFTGDVTTTGVVRIDGRVLYLNAGTSRYLQWDNSADAYILGGAVPLKDASGRIYYHTGNISGASVNHAGSADSASLANGLATNGLSAVAMIQDNLITLAKMNSSAADAAAGTGSLRTLGTTSTSAAAGNHTHAAGDAATLDGIDSTQFARVDASSNFTIAPTIQASTVAKIKAGTYTGNGAGHAITGVGFVPLAVFVTSTQSGHTSFSFLQNNKVVTPSSPTVAANDGTVSLISDGFTFTDAGGGANINGISYSYLAYG